ncbi:DUF4184 family protein [Micromonospora sp. NPDC049559]|uniref:DUF4184 family protein n=1 Tax=Micromonospora sp. NPDC049559 TaxID=3155923 RepID=UPI00341A945B
MPLTFPSHLAPVLPLKLWRPRWFDGVALVCGAVAPDLSYVATNGRGDLFADTHALPALLWWCLPVALAGTWLLRRSAGTIAAHLPRSRWFAWRDYGVLGSVRHRWWITVGSALLGAATHVGWDWLTHTDGWLSTLFGVHWYEATGVPWWTVSDLTSTAVGALVTVLLAARIGRRRLLLAGAAPPARPVPRRPGVFWGGAAVVAAVGCAALPHLPAAGLLAATVVRILCVFALALLAGALAVRVVTASRPAPRTGRSSGAVRPD